MDDTQISQLDKEIDALQAKRQALLEKNRHEALSSILNRIATYGFTAAELGFASGGRASNKQATVTAKGKQPAKYANPDNPSQTWAGGKGPTPKWVKEQQAAGKTLDDLLIK